MSYESLRALCQSIFGHLNATNSVPTPDDIWAEHANEIERLSAIPELSRHFTSLDATVQSPRIVEAARILRHLRQRFGASSQGRPLVGRMRADVIVRQRPRRDRARTDLTSESREIAELTPAHWSRFSDFHIRGWRQVLQAIHQRTNLIIVAPTGSGKTETFLLPLVYDIARALRDREVQPARFVLLYPRVELLKDQLARVLRYAHQAEQNHLAGQRRLGGMGSSAVRHGIVIGIQFQGIRAQHGDTRGNRDIFAADGTFTLVPTCPVCSQGAVRYDRRRDHITHLRCTATDCNAEFRLSIAKNDHVETRPHILVTTAESLDRLYLMPTPLFEDYLRSITGIVFDEVHLYYSLYGAHIHNVINRIEELQSGRRLAKIAASATVAHPERFAAKLFNGDEHQVVPVHDASHDPQAPAGLEVAYFLQSPEEENRPGAAPTLIQSAMALGHGVLAGEDRSIIFTESLDLAGRFAAQIGNAEAKKKLWSFRVDLPAILFDGASCPGTTPGACPHVYQHGECWRGLLGGRTCTTSIVGLRTQPLEVVQVSSQQRGRYWAGKIIVATPALEVGVDDERIKATIHYLPPRTVFSFIQRRGRAGRVTGETAYTLMILGNTAADQFYFYRRHRLIHGTYELPLNPHNPIVRDMHEVLRRERDQLGASIANARRTPEGTWRWVWDHLMRCRLIQRHYGADFTSRTNHSMADQRGFVQRWIGEQRASVEQYLNLRWLLGIIEDESPDELRDAAAEALEAISQYVTTGTGSADDIGRQLEELSARISGLLFREQDDSARVRLRATRDRIEAVWHVVAPGAMHMATNEAERLYNFFRTLEGLYEAPWVLLSPPDTLKIVLQALFYLHLGVDEMEDEGTCPARVAYLVPSAYFQAVRPLLVEVRYEAAETERHPEIKQEDVTTLSTWLIPYKPVYRYHDHPFLSVLDTEHNPVWVTGNRVMLRPRDVVGVRHAGALVP